MSMMKLIERVVVLCGGSIEAFGVESGDILSTFIAGDELS